MASHFVRVCVFVYNVFETVTGSSGFVYMYKQDGMAQVMEQVILNLIGVTKYNVL